MTEVAGMKPDEEIISFTRNEGNTDKIIGAGLIFVLLILVCHGLGGLYGAEFA